MVQRVSAKIRKSGFEAVQMFSPGLLDIVPELRYTVSHRPETTRPSAMATSRGSSRHPGRAERKLAKPEDRAHLAGEE